MPTSTIPGRLYLGCPVWAYPGWRGALYTRDARREDFLPQYARVFDAVEGNATFYGLPTEATVRRWCVETPPGFRFSFKFPRVVTHVAKLEGADRETAAFLGRMALLPDRLGPLLLQLGPNFGARDLPRLDRFLAALPAGLAIAVEVRHSDFHGEGPGERDLDALLVASGAARGNFDTQDVFAAPAADETTEVAQGRKPRLPRRATHTAGPAFVRFVGRNAVADSAPGLGFWVERVAGWLEAGIDVHFFTHTPDDALAPELARLFHRMLAVRVPTLPALAPFPGESTPDRQVGLFGPS
jgi:uncharacterized protein YecE (DUF72 family)